MLQTNKKYNFAFGRRKVVINKLSHEGEFHPYAKALVFALYHKQYRSLRLEPQLPDERFQPDLCAMDYDGTMLFWSEVGNVSLSKIEKLFKKYRRAHFVFVKEQQDVPGFEKHLSKLVKSCSSLPLIDIVVYPPHFQEWNVSPQGDVFVRKEDLEIVRWHAPQGHKEHF
ncbi:MAG: hypothetical protein KGI24_02990 [Candidatus Omnitrophica bacterium]|nr:hypothetical protein [Candidatus Omnitrophota bacterium]MDE2231244.1 hypothetical protein [Candidatus Omnitrophota bacterium]